MSIIRRHVHRVQNYRIVSTTKRNKKERGLLINVKGTSINPTPNDGQEILETLKSAGPISQWTINHSTNQTQ